MKRLSVAMVSSQKIVGAALPGKAPPHGAQRKEAAPTPYVMLLNCRLTRADRPASVTKSQASDADEAIACHRWERLLVPTRNEARWRPARYFQCP